MHGCSTDKVRLFVVSFGIVWILIISGLLRRREMGCAYGDREVRENRAKGRLGRDGPVMSLQS